MAVQVRRRSHTRGITLTELMVVSVITLLVGMGVFSLMLRAWQNHDALLTQNLVQRQARQALDLACDELRAISPWTADNVIATQDANGSVFGQLNPSLTSNQTSFSVSLDKGRLVMARYLNAARNLATPGATVSNIAAFAVTYDLRVRTDDGSLLFVTAPSAGVSPIDNDPSGGITGNSDARVGAIVAAHIWITASRKAPNGITYSCTLTDTVKIRNQTYSIAPPAGG